MNHLPTEDVPPPLSGIKTVPTTARRARRRFEVTSLAVFPTAVQHPLLDGFEMLGRLGAGAAGEVYLAKSRAGRKVAIKILREPKDGEEEAWTALSREATLCVRLSHPAIVQVRAFIEGDGLAALVLDYVDGPPLARLMRLAGLIGARLPDRVAWHMVERILAGLLYAHSQRDEEGGLAPIVHRDLSPANVLIDWTGDVKITDFGIAKMLGVSPATRYGLVKGTPGCMAPEQARGEPVDQRADVYAAGLLAWRLATGRLPFDPRMEEVELLRAMRYPKIRPLSALRADLPHALVEAVDVALAPELTNRTIDAHEFHRIVTRSIDLEAGRAELRELLGRWRGQLERVKSPKDAASSSSDSSGDKKIPTLRYEEVDVLEQDYPMDSPTVEAHALPGDESAWAQGAPASSTRGAALPALPASPNVPTPGVPRAVMKVDLLRVMTPLATVRPPAKKSRVWETVGAVAIAVFLVVSAWMLRRLR
jgi:serine/threonine protein kinase